MKIEEIKQNNTKTAEYATLLLKILLDGAVIKEISGSKKKYFITANFNGDKMPIKEYYRNYALIGFPTEKGARGWCKRKRVDVIGIDREGI